MESVGTTTVIDYHPVFLLTHKRCDGEARDLRSKSGFLQLGAPPRPNARHREIFFPTAKQKRLLADDQRLNKELLPRFLMSDGRPSSITNSATGKQQTMAQPTLQGRRLCANDLRGRGYCVVTVEDEDSLFYTVRLWRVPGRSIASSTTARLGSRSVST